MPRCGRPVRRAVSRPAARPTLAEVPLADLSLGSFGGTFTSITTPNDGSFYAGLNFADSGNGKNKWIATKCPQTLEFTHSTGNLVIVPEPSSLALAGRGVAAAAWAARRRRRGSHTCGSSNPAR
jgi:hypothetical protein